MLVRQQAAADELTDLLSSVCGWALRALPLNTTGLLLIGTVGLLNCAFGMLAMWRLMRVDPAPAAWSAPPPRTD